MYTLKGDRLRDINHTAETPFSDRQNFYVTGVN